MFMFRLFGLLLVGLVLAGCQTTPSSNNIGDAVKTTLNSKHCGDLGRTLINEITETFGLAMGVFGYV
jgi:hypothetical protein